MVHKDGLCVSYFILTCAIIISSGFAFWLYKDTELIKYTDLVRDSRKLLFYKQYEDADKLRKETMAEVFDDKVDIIWLPLIKNEKDGYVKFQMYLRLLESNPDYEIIYRDIAALMDLASEEYQTKDKPHYLKALMAIEGVHHVLLERYDLLVTAENK